ncbi:MAG TPA: hypothetical protein LFV91_03660 [Rickettsia endosymbiont of Bembidion nr. Transversale]|nr:hypothetical protein [Rickettsia endosymbiont of Bembidion nr. Transversale]
MLLLLNIPPTSPLPLLKFTSTRPVVVTTIPVAVALKLESNDPHKEAVAKKLFSMLDFFPHNL